MNSEQLAADLAKDLPNFSLARRQQILATLPVETAKLEATKTADTLVAAKGEKPAAKPITANESWNQPTPANMSFKQRAQMTLSRGIPIVPVKPDSKTALLPLLPDGSYPCSADPQQIDAWDKLYPNFNHAAVAEAKIGGFWMWEVDSLDVLDRLKKETGHSMDEVQTFIVRSRQGRGHYYFRQSLASIAMGNLNQAYLKEGDHSARVKNMYVVGANSIHPKTHEP